ncbi:endonuclease domain-containing protein [Rhizobium leguminosarum]|uniref:endonuclease domain-containing protein n=1 Tax=Rhizobium leguminosarum TaxID=384 RepID=UPI001C9716DE|nr:endonuclease domain-containing protein [Rhizobium leguminosarum]MBY5316720.1 hypothetical protein [Rhizobium leguminosarum]
MIRNRPKHLLDQDGYNKFPSEPFFLGIGAVPELLRGSLEAVTGIQPVTTAMLEAAGGAITDMPTSGEVQLFNNLGTKFQLISIVANLALLRKTEENWEAIPYCITLIPASKRDRVDERPINAIAKLDIGEALRKTQPSYTGYDPFTGDWGLYAPLGDLIERRYGGLLDELGVVLGAYHLATTFTPEQVAEIPLGFENPRLEEKYARHRARLLYQPFTEIRPRRLWGIESPIELFLFQELLHRGIQPTPQVLFYDDGSAHTSLYHLWRDIEFRYAPGMITEADFYLSDRKIAIFCDSGAYHRGNKAREKDSAIDERLAKFDIRSVRIRGREIVEDLKTAADRVSELL